ncbi:MAG: DsrE family protein [Lentimicrobiaceae bacterium]|jgi:intracellular sulfur oxidation DsrE/DsrF family protein
MNKKKWMKILFLSFLVVCVGQAKSQIASDTKSKLDEHKIVIDIPVDLGKANVVFNMDHLAFAGDLPVGINYMHLLANRFQEMKTKGQIIGVFQGDAAYMTLNDETYNIYRKVTTGNPYKGLIAELIKQGVQIEECAVSMKGHAWGNENLLSGVKVNSGAVSRLIQLMQDGYVQIQP